MCAVLNLLAAVSWPRYKPRGLPGPAVRAACDVSGHGGLIRLCRHNLPDWPDLDAVSAWQIGVVNRHWLSPVT